MEKKGLTLSLVFKAESANYGESIGNVSTLKKIFKNDGEQYTYISRQALRYNIVNQMGVDHTEIGLDGTVLQFSEKATIDQYPEIDLFGYMKTSGTTKTRSAVVRLSNAISLEPYRGDLDFLTNKNLLDRYNKNNNGEKKLKDGGNIAQSEIHNSLYTYTIVVDLDKVGIDENEKIEDQIMTISNTEKAERINLLLDTIRYLYRDIKGRREDLKPLFAIGGVYKIKNPIFQNAIDVSDNCLNINLIQEELTPTIEKETSVGCHSGVFDNESSIKEKLKALSIQGFFERIKKAVKDYYESN